MDLPITITLTRPVRHGEDEVRQFVISRPMVAGDLKGVRVSALTFDDLMLVASRLVGYPPSVIASLSMPDFTRLNEVVTSFLGDGPETGSKA